MKQILRKTLSELTYLAIRFFDIGSDGLRILMYHRVTDAYPDDRLCVKVSEFTKQMKLLQEEGWQVISLSHAVKWLNSQTAKREGEEAKVIKNQKSKIKNVDIDPSRCVVLTFDDGFEDNYVNAYPLLAKYGFTGCFFVPTGFVEAGQDTHVPDTRPMSWQQLRTLIDNGHEVGAHSVTHSKLTTLDSTKMVWEVRSSKSSIERSLQYPVDYFCYPNGDYDDAVWIVVKDSGYVGACTVEPGDNRPGIDPWMLKRTEISGFDSLRDFKKKLHGAYDWMHKMRQLQRQ